MNDMTPEGRRENEYVERLRAADPAVGSTPDLAVLRATVTARVADVESPVDELADQRAKRAGRAHRNWFPAAAAVAVLAVGLGSGYAIGVARSPATGASSEIATVVQDELRQSAPAVAEADSVARSEGAELTLAPQFAGGARRVFHPGVLSDEATTAHTWALDTASLDPARTVAELARLVGVTGEPREESGDWLAGQTDGTGAMVWFSPRTGSLSFHDPAADPWTCGVDGSTQSSEEDLCPERDLGPTPSTSEAEKQLSDLLVAEGLDPADYEFTSQKDDRYTSVTAELLIDNTRTGLSWGATYTGAGLLSLNGTVVRLVDLGDYPVVSPTDAVERLNDPRFGATGDVAARAGGQAFEEQTASPSVQSEGDSSNAVPETPLPGSPLPWAVQDVTINTATLEWAPYTTPDGAVLLAPTYRLVGDGDVRWEVVALADAVLDFS